MTKIAEQAQSECVVRNLMLIISGVSMPGCHKAAIESNGWQERGEKRA